MKSLSEVEFELSKLGIHNRFWGRPEVKELTRILTDDEVITQAANGRYHGGFAMLVTTNHRLLLVDKKLWFMSLEDVRFDMITEVDFSARILDATMSIRTINKVLQFTAINQGRLRRLTHYLQERILELRQMSIQQAQAANQPAPVQYIMVPQPPVPVQQPPAVAPTDQPVVANNNYTRPGRLRRVGSFPTASFTMSQQRYVQARH